MNNLFFIIVTLVIYVGSAAIGVQIFGEGGTAVLFAAIVGSVAFFGFYSLIIKKTDDDS